MPDSSPLTPLQQAVIALRSQRARIAELEQAGSAPIAVVGMACRYPAGADSAEALWQAVRDGRDGSREVPKDRWDIDAFYDPTPGSAGKMYVRNSCFIDRVDGFEPLFFRISPREAVGIDPQQRLLLEVTWEALEDAAIPPPSLVGSQTGVFIGISTNDYSALLSRTVHGSGSNASAGAGNAASVASGRLSYTFGFQGPCMAIDTACSSSLVATHLAVQSLRNRECGLAVVAGVNLMLTPDITVNFCLGRMLSPDGHCKTFDESADGYARGEGCGVVILKRLSDAVNDGDRVLAVIRGSALGQDGRSAGLTAPNGLAQEAVIRKALANAGLAPDAVDYIEAHGTGTALGDPIEMHALKSVFRKRDRPLHVGSVKTNIGHTEAAAGVAGLIKAVAMLRNQALPPTLHFRKLNPHIDLGGVDIRVPTELAAAEIRAVGVSSFGFSGTNAHVVLERAEPMTPPPAQATKLLISARTEQGLRALIARYREYLAETTDSFADICHTAAIGRARLPWWVAVESPEALTTAAPSNAPLPTLPPTTGRKVRLPVTPFQRERFWIDGAVESATIAVAEIDERLPPLLGRKLSLPFSTESRWEAAISARHPALGFLAEHTVNGSVVLPASAYVEMILAALPGSSIVELEITAPLVLADEAPRVVQTIVGADGRFRIASCAADGGDPQLHASGRTQPRTAPPSAIPPLAGGSALPADDLYAAMARRGVVHGPAFRLLGDVRRIEGTAVATLRETADESRFSIHPARLDSVLQLVAAALPESGAEVMVPAGIGRLSLFRRPAPGAIVQALARREAGEVLADITVSDADGVALAIEQLRFRPAPLPASERGFYRIDWRAEPLIENLAAPAFLPELAALAERLNAAGQRLAIEHGAAAYDAIGGRLEEAATGYIVRALRTLGLPLQAGAEFTFAATAEALGIAERHHRLLRRLLRLLADDGVLKQAGRRFWVRKAPVDVDPDAMLDVLVAEAPAMQGEIGVLRRCGGALAEVLTGRRDPLTLLFPTQGEGAGAFYETSPYARTVNGLLHDVAKALAGSLPRGRTLRVLEVGAGTGGATGAVLEGLAPTRPHYVFTDLSASFLGAARQKFAGTDLKTQILDIERPPAEQGIAAQGFDVVLAANVLHATRDLRRTLAHVRETLAPGGVLLLVESTAARRWVDIVFGLTEGWWRFADKDLRPDHPLLSREAWSRLLREQGFDTADTVGEVIVARRADAATVPIDSTAHVHVVPPAAAAEDDQVALLGRLIDVAKETAAAGQRLVLVGDGSAGHDGLPGFVRTLQLEMPALQPRLLRAPPSDVAAHDEVVGGESESEVRWNAEGRREVPRLMQAGVGAAPDKVEGVWLITGARGGVAQAIAAWLASRGASALVLVSRRQPQPPAGVAVPVHCHAGDAADVDVIVGLLRRHRVQGVVHAAGLLADATLAEQTEETIRAVARGKLGGALALDRATRTHPVQHFVLCSSVAGVVGSARQVNHAFCAAFLDGIAQRRQADGLPALSVDWGVWSGIGSAAVLGFDQMAEQLGLGSIAPAQGTALFGRALADPRPQLVALPSVEWPRFVAHFGGKPPALLRDVSTVVRPAAPAPGAGAQPAAPDRHAALARIVASCLGIGGTVDPATPFHDLGLDSLIAVEIRNRVENELGLAVSVRELIEGASLSTLVARLGDAPAPVAAPAADGRIAMIVSAVLGLGSTPDETIPLHDLGLDSLMAVEIRNRLENEAGIVVSVRELIEGASIRSLKESTAAPTAAPSAPALPAARPVSRRQATPDLAHRNDPFPLTDMQQAYWLGRRNDVALGSVSCYLYTEFDTDKLDIARVEAAWNVLIKRHDMLRAVISADGMQRILPEVPQYRFRTLDLRGRDAGPELDQLRRSLPQRVTEPEAWPLFDIRVTLLDGKARLHMGFDLIALDAASIHALRREWGLLYDEPATVLPAVPLSFRDVVMEQIAYRESEAWKRSERYWKARAQSLPPSSDLPLAPDATERTGQRFRRLGTIVPAEGAQALRRQAQARGLTLPTLLASVYADVLARWSRSQHFCITVTSFNRPDLHPAMAQVLGDYTSTIQLEVDARAERFADRATRLARQLADDVEHSEYSGIQVMREIARQTASAAAYMGVVFTSALGFRRASAGPESESGGWDRLGTTVYNVSSTPQVLIDNQISEEDGQLLCNWDVAEDLFAPGVVDAMFAAYEALLQSLAAGAGWDDGARLPASALPRAPLLPGPMPDLLHAAFEAQARHTPERVALIAPDAELSYGQLDAAAGHLAAAVAARLGDQRRDRLVAIVLPKGWRQVVAVLAILKTGAAYLPIDPALPAERRRLLIERGEAIVLDDPAVVDAALAAAKAGSAPPVLPSVTDPSCLSYVIYTSGSTGEPKGVMIEHQAAVTTVAEINRRWSVGPEDRVFGLSSLSFDLSVYDIFGPLSVGGALVLPAAEASRDPSQWADLLSRHSVTIWNSVPALMAMQAEYGLPADHRLRLVMMSGDWVPVDLVKTLRERAPGLKIAALGGATEAAIWSNAHEVGTAEVAALDPAWTSIPYGTPLAGQMLHVVNGRAEECPDWVIGEIEISGAGVARGYWRDPRQTAERFRIDPRTGERRYRTGDLGRFRPYGQGGPTPIEFLGREDFQVKVQGYRIELGEIETALATHPDVQQAVVTAPFAANKRDRSLHGFVVPRVGAGTGSMPAGGGWQAIVDAGQAALAAHASAISHDDFDITAGTFGDQAAAAAAQALHRLTGSYELPDAETLIRDHGVAPRYRLWLERMLPEVARVGMGAEPVSSQSIAGVDHFGFGPEALDFLDKVIASLPDLLTERRHSSSIYLDAKTPDVYARLFATPNAAIGALITTLAAARPLSILEVGGGLGTTLSAIEPTLPVDRVAYHFTDVSPLFLRAAAAKFAARPWLTFGPFDLDGPVPPEHVGRHDVIVASSAAHVAKDVAQALAALRACLKPGGVLILLEETRFFPWFDLGMGLQSGFDTRSDVALRPLHPLLTRSAWTRLLQAAGFDSAQALAVPGSIEDLMGFDVILAQLGETAATAGVRGDAGLQETLRTWLAERLPAYMVPTTISAIDRIPLSANGKVDRRALVPPAARPDAETTAVSDRLTREIGDLVAGMLNLPTVDPNRSLFELGATSLTLVSLQRLIANRLGRTIGLQQIFERPTVAGFAAEIAGRRSVTTPLITFGARREGDERPKLVLMPAIFSLPFYLREMAEMMADQVDIVSVQLPGLAENEKPIDSIAAQADYVVERMRLGGLRAPFMVGGHSFGGRVAIEVARRLRLAGEDVPLLLLGDTVRTFGDYGPLQSDAMAYTGMARGLYELYGRLAKVPYEAIAHLEPEARFQATARHMQEEGLFGVLDLPLDRMLAVFKANFRAITGYRPGPIPGDMAVIRTEGKYPPEFLEYETADALNDPTLGWGSLVQGKVDSRSMPGDHMAMLNPTNLTVMTRIMVDLVRESLAMHLSLRHGVTLGAEATPTELAREIRRRQQAAP